MIFPAVLLLLAGILGWAAFAIEDPQAGGMFCFSALVLIGCAAVRLYDNLRMRPRP